MLIRTATQADAEALARIYGHHVLTGLGTFEEVPPAPEEMNRRRANVAGHGLPYLVAEDSGQVLAFAYAAPFRLRAAYRYCVEDSVYVASEAVGRGLGKAVLSRVLADCEAAGIRQVVAVIGDSGNAASIGLHRSLGFLDNGASRSVGYKFGRWVDIVYMQKPLNGGDAGLPDAPGLSLSGV